jgi:hypothetical protein
LKDGWLTGKSTGSSVGALRRPNQALEGTRGRQLR